MRRDDERTKRDGGTFGKRQRKVEIDGGKIHRPKAKLESDYNRARESRLLDQRVEREKGNKCKDGRDEREIAKRSQRSKARVCGDSKTVGIGRGN